MTIDGQNPGHQSQASRPGEPEGEANDPMKCPICKKEVKLGDPEAPFCSERCRIIDLGNWASEKYVISTPARREELLPPDDDGDPR